MAYISIPVEVDPSAITQQKIDDFEASMPGVVVQVATPLYFLLEVTSDRDAQNLQQLTEVTDLIWDTFGQKIQRLPRNAATQATADTTWTRVDVDVSPLGAPLTIPAGTGLSLAGPTGDRIDFQTRNAVTFAAGAASTAAGEVQIVAVTPGADGTGLQADPRPNETLVWLDAITLVSPTAGGADEEDVDGYRNRLADKVSLRGDTLVLANDFAVAARNVTGVDVAMAIDNYDPGPPIVNPAAGHITVAVRDVNSADPGSTIRANVLAALQADAMSGLATHVIAPTFTAMTVVFAAKAYPQFDPADVLARAIQAVKDFFARWGILPFGDQRQWVDRPIVRYRDLIAAIENVDGLDYTASASGTASTSNGSPNLTLVTPTTGWVNGMAISGAGIPAGTRILSGAGTATMVMSANATATASGVAITGAAVTLNGATGDVTLTGPAALPAANPTVTGAVT